MVFEPKELAYYWRSYGRSTKSRGDEGWCNFWLNALDFAFVLRSNDSWTYAIVAEKSFHKDLGLVIRFVLDKNGTTKTIRRKYWGKGVRPVNSSSG